MREGHFAWSSPDMHRIQHGWNRQSIDGIWRKNPQISYSVFSSKPLEFHFNNFLSLWFSIQFLFDISLASAALILVLRAKRFQQVHFSTEYFKPKQQSNKSKLSTLLTIEMLLMFCRRFLNESKFIFRYQCWPLLFRIYYSVLQKMAKPTLSFDAIF